MTGRISLRSPEYSADLVLGERGARDQLALPLPSGDGVGHQDQRGGRAPRPWRRRRPASCPRRREHDDAGAAGPEVVHGLLLVVAQRPALLVQLDRVGLAVDVAGEVLGGPADLEQRLLEPAALGRDGRRPCRCRCARRAAAAIFFWRSTSSSTARSSDDQNQPVDRVLDQLQPAVPVHRVGDVDEQRVRHRVAGVTHQRVDDLLGVVPGCSGVPQPERGQAVGVHVLGDCAPARRTARSPSAASAASGWSTSSRSVLSDWTMRGPSVTCPLSQPAPTLAVDRQSSRTFTEVSRCSGMLRNSRVSVS